MAIKKPEINIINRFIKYLFFKFIKIEHPKIIGKINNQNLHGISSNTEYIIVAHPDFLIPANRLAQLHENKNNSNIIR